MTEESAPSVIPWEQVAAAASALGAQTRLAEMAARFLALVESWATPSAVLCAYRDPAGPDGVRMVPELTSGAVSGAPERALAKLFAEHPPDSLTRPTLLGPAEGPAGFKVRDTLVIPWSHGSSVTGFLVLRGLPRPQPSNLGDVVVLLSQAMWPRVVPPVSASPGASPAAGEGAEDRLRELGRLAQRLAADWQEARSAAESERKKLDAQVEMLQGEVEAGKAAVSAAEQGRAAGEAAVKAREQVETERDAARAEATELKTRVDAQLRDLDAARAQAESNRAAADAASAKAKEQAEAERDGARTEAAELKARVEALQRDLGAARADVESGRASAEAASGKAKEQAETERDAARNEASELKTRVEALQRDLDAARAQAESSRAGSEAASGKAKEQAESERDAARTEAAELKTRVESLQRELDAARAQAESSRAGSEAASGKAKEQAESERDAARAEAAELKGRVETLQRDLEAARGEVAQLKGRVETVQHDLDMARSQAEGASARADAAGKAREQTEAERDAARGEAAEQKARVEALQRDLDTARAAPTPLAESGPERERWTKSESVFRSAVEAIRRTPFLPPTVRVWVGEVESLLDAKPAAAAQLGRILLLDRDAPMLSALAGELEQAGLDVLIAHHPDEVSLFMKTPDAQGLTALVLDVLALRPEQSLADLVRAWRHDSPGLAVFLTFRADNATEAERAQRLPSTATAGYLPRPLQKKTLLDAVANLARRSPKH